MSRIPKDSSGHQDASARHLFTLTLSVADLTDELASAIYALDIDDVLVGQRGANVFVDFNVEGAGFADAILSAIQQIEKALPKVTVLGVHSPGEEAIQEANTFLKARQSERLVKLLRQ